MKRHVYVLTTETDKGNTVTAYATQEQGERAYIDTVNEFYDVTTKAYEEAQAEAGKVVGEGSMDFVALEKCEIEGYFRPEIVIYVQGGVVQGVSATERMGVNLIDFDNLKAEGKTREECSAILKDSAAGLVGIF